MKAKELFNRLQGAWKIKKNLGDLGSGTGFATFKASGDLLECNEKLRVSIGDFKNISGSTSCTYRLINDDIYSRFLFQDSFAKMHILEKDNQANTAFYCGLDSYYTKYSFDDHSFTRVCEVRGPLKNYDIVTNFVRITERDLSEVMGFLGDSETNDG